MYNISKFNNNITIILLIIVLTIISAFLYIEKALYIERRGQLLRYGPMRVRMSVCMYVCLRIRMFA